MGRYAVNMNRTNPVRNEEGFVLVAAMMVLLILVVLGISATSTSMLEVQIAGNERVGKTTFYEADGGTEVSSELLEQNWCGGGLGFSTSDIDGNIVVNQTATGAYDFWAAVGTSDPEYPEYHELPSLPADPDPADASDPGVRAFFWPTGYDADGGNLPHTNVTLAGRQRDLGRAARSGTRRGPAANGGLRGQGERRGPECGCPGLQYICPSLRH